MIIFLLLYNNNFYLDYAYSEIRVKLKSEYLPEINNQKDDGNFFYNYQNKYSFPRYKSKYFFFLFHFLIY